MVGGVIDGWLQGDFALSLRAGSLTTALALSQYGDQVVTNRAEIYLQLINVRLSMSDYQCPSCHDDL